LDKEIVHSGMPKLVEKAKIALLDASIENKKTEYDSKLNIDSPELIDAFLNQEEALLQEMAEKIIKTGANVVICQKGIDDMAQHFLARKGVVAIRRAKKSDMEKLAKATGGHIVSKIDTITSNDLGYAELVEERKVADDKLTFIEGCKNPQAVTILIRGGTARLTAEAERSLHDALCVIRDIIHEPKIVAGGSAPELEISSVLRKYAESLAGRESLAVKVYAETLETIPEILIESAGLQTIDVLSELRARHEKGETWAGIDAREGKIQDMNKNGVYEPIAVKKQIIKSATEAATMLLKIDDVIAAGKMKAPPMPPGGGMPGGEYPGMGGMGGMGEY
jgi:chaperonin GroEL (HSP60 family)